MTTLTPLSALLSSRRREAGRSHFDIPADWLQGRTSFGGLVATLAVQAMRDVAGEAWPTEVRLRALQTSFIGPVAMGPLEVEVKLLREGKNVRQVQAWVQQEGQTAALLIGVFGVDRETALPVLSPSQPSVAHRPEDMPERNLPADIVPRFIQHMDMRFVEGAAPFSGTPSRHSRVHIKLKGEPVNELPAELLTVLLADVPPTPVLSHFTELVPASSVSWELELRPAVAETQGWWRVDTEVLASAGGYVNQATRLWSPSGELAALGYQVVTVYG